MPKDLISVANKIGLECSRVSEMVSRQISRQRGIASLASSSCSAAMSTARLDGLDLVRECVGGGGNPPPSLVGVDGS